MQSEKASDGRVRTGSVPTPIGGLAASAADSNQFAGGQAGECLADLRHQRSEFLDAVRLREQHNHADARRSHILLEFKL